VGDRYDILLLFDILFDGFRAVNALDQAMLIGMTEYLSSFMYSMECILHFKNGVYSQLYSSVMLHYQIGFIYCLF
jgi:hypothetical protein